MTSITVIGAANIDILASPEGKYVPGDSNPGQVEIAFGGVGRNIAHNLCLLGCRVRLVTVFGNDAVARTLIADCRRIGMDLGTVRTVGHARSNYFLCINDDAGEMRAAVSDMALMNHLTPELLEKELPDILSADAVVADCNLPEVSLRFLAERVRKPLYFDATSSAKAIRLSFLKENPRDGVTVKLNRMEADALGGLPVRTVRTLGAEGASCDGILLPADPVKIVNSTGAGDAFFAGFIYAECTGKEVRDALEKGQEAARLTLQSKNAVNEEIKRIRYESTSQTF